MKPKSQKPPGKHPPPFPIVGIGASAGGLEAFTQLLKHLPVDTGMGFVLVQHLNPVHESELTRILSRATSMPTCEVTNNLRVEPNHVYVIPPNANMAIVKGVLKLQPRPQGRVPHRSIDFFFEALAQDQCERAIGVILSGTATDGTLGLEAIKAEGGITFAQDESAKQDSMPRSAIASGCVDLVLAPAAIAQELARIAAHPYLANVADDATKAETKAGDRASNQSGENEREVATAHQNDASALPSGGRGTPSGGAIQARAEAAHAPERADENGFKKILLILRHHCGVDFSLYKSSTIQRRVGRRMILAKRDTLDEYAGFLKGNVTELDTLFSDVLISVTSFFRNPDAFETLKHTVFPRLLKQLGHVDPLRVWVLGCSTGQEAYSIAMSFAEFSDNIPRAPRLQVFATDLNDALLDKARHGLYAKTLAQDVSPERLRRFFVEEPGGYRVVKPLREQIVFARQNLVSDPPFSRMDLISCRNLLIYLEPGLQKKIIPSFHYALKSGGFLLLGTSESIGQFTDLFQAADKKQKIFSRKAAPTQAFKLPLAHERTSPRTPGRFLPAPLRAAQDDSLHGELNAQREADRAAVNQFSPPGVLINSELQIVQFRGATSAYLEPPTGKASFDVLKMARGGLMLPLRAAINKAKKENQAVRKNNVRLDQDGDTQTVNIHVMPLKNLKERSFLILFEPVDARSAGRPVPIAAPPQRRNKKEESRRIAELERELVDTRNYLQSLQEQSEAANEELQASNEEVQSANEELQSINEELESSKEELESTNEELTTVNEEMASRNVELNRLVSDLRNLQVNIHTPIVLLGRDLTIRRFTSSAEKVFNLMAGDIGRPFGSIRHNLLAPAGAQATTDSQQRQRQRGGVAQSQIAYPLETVIREVIDTVSVHESEVQDNHGHWYSLRVRPYTTLDNKIDGAVLVLVDIDALKRSEQEARAAREYAEATLRTIRDPLVILHGDLRVDTANEAFYQTFKLRPEETQGRLIHEINGGLWNIPELRRLLEDVQASNSFFNDFEVTHTITGIGRRMQLLNARRLQGDEGTLPLILLSIEDVTERLQARADVKLSEIRYRRMFETAQDGILIIDPVTRKITDANPYLTTLLGYTRGEMVGKELWQIGLFEDEQASAAAFRELQQRGFLRYEDLPLKTKDGRTIEVESICTLYDEGDARVIQCNIRDITSRKRAQDELREAAAELRDANRHKDEFLAMLAHELRNPLAPIYNAVQVLRLAGGDAQTVQSASHMMERQIGHMARLVDDLLDASRITHGKIELRLGRTEVASVIHHAVEATRPLMQDMQHQLAVTLPPQPVYVNADPIRLAQIIGNLLNNACKFTDKGGHIALSVECVDGQVHVRVRDNGIGIAADQRSRVFEMFTQLDTSLERSTSGLGIGLALVKNLVEMHGGAVDVHSDGLDKGSEFVVRLPIVAPPRAPSPEPAAGQATPAAARRILIVDDNIDSAASLAMLLELTGHQTHRASDGLEAVEAAATYRPDLVLLDIGLPKLNGYEVARRIRSHAWGKQMLLIAMTGWGQDEDRRKSRDAGFNGHLVKPVDYAALTRLLAESVIASG